MPENIVRAIKQFYYLKTYSKRKIYTYRFDFMTSKLIQWHNIKIEGNLIAGKTIVFGHGFGTDQTAWQSVKTAFEKDYRIILYDNAGAGKLSAETFSSLKYSSLNGYSEDLISILNAFNLTDVIMVAHSVSSMIALLAAIKKPEYFSRLIFIGASPRYLNDENYYGGFDQAQLDAMYENMRTNYYAWVSGFSAAAMGNPDKPELSHYFASTLSSIRPDIALSVAKTIFESDIRKKLHAIKKPILLIQSQKDIAVPMQVARYLNENIRDSTLVTVNAEGHFPHISAPNEIIKAIKEFIFEDE